MTGTTFSRPNGYLLADLLHERRVRAGGGRLVELAGGEGALQGVVLVLDLLQLEVLPLRRLRAKTGPGTNSQNGSYGRMFGIFNAQTSTNFKRAGQYSIVVSWSSPTSSTSVRWATDLRLWKGEHSY